MEVDTKPKDGGFAIYCTKFCGNTMIWYPRPGEDSPGSETDPVIQNLLDVKCEKCGQKALPREVFTKIVELWSNLEELIRYLKVVQWHEF